MQWAGKSDHPAPEGWTDRFRYHGKGNKIISLNWDSDGGFDKGSALPSALGTQGKEVKEEYEHDDEYEVPKKNIPLPKSPKAALKHPDIITFQEVCDRIPGMPDYALIIETIQYFRSLVPDEKKLIATLKPYWLAWKERGYSTGNYAWMTEWAINGTIPPPTRASPKGKTFADMAKEFEKDK